MKRTFFFYDLETSGLNSRYQRIMQFGGQRTDMELKPIGEPINLLVRLSEDILPEPGAILITGTTPQQTQAEGISEPELARLFMREVCQPGTIVVGFNNIRFDDEFIRHLLWRNFYDPYEWAYQDGRSRWDMLDVVRMTRALRPDGIEWPFDSKNQPTNRLEQLSKANNLTHGKAHDALSDVEATIAMTRLVKQKQPKLFSFLLKLRAKDEIAKLVNPAQPQPFVYSSGRYGKQKSFTTVAAPLAPGSRPGTVLIYDLSVDPDSFIGLSQAEITKKLLATREERANPDFKALPIKELVYNRCPAVAPLGVMDQASWQRLELDETAIKKHFEIVKNQPEFKEKVVQSYNAKPAYVSDKDVEGQLYDGFVSDSDKPRMTVIRDATAQQLSDLQPQFADQRFDELFVRYKGRWFPKSLSDSERQAWQVYRQEKFVAMAPKFTSDLEKYALSTVNDNEAQFLLEELKLWYENTAPIEW